MSFFLSVLEGLGFAAALVCFFTWVSTTIRFRTDAKRQQETRNDAAIVVPLKPYIVPGLGSSLSFLNKKIGRVWRPLMHDCQRWNLSAVSLLIAGTRTHVLFAPRSILSEFRAKQLTRYKHARLLATNVLGMSQAEAAKAFPQTLDPKTDITLERIHSEFLLTSFPVTILTDKFMDCLLASTTADNSIRTGSEIELYSWIKAKLFDASTTALFGSKLLDMHPDLNEDFWLWEQNLVVLLFGTPRIFAQKAYASRDSLLDKLSDWLEEGYKHTEELPANTEWEPYFGARVMRERHAYYQQQKLSIRSQAGKEMIFLAGILSNAIPTIGWLLMHILSPTSPPDLLPRITEELRTAVRPDGSIDVPALVRLPLINSTLNETLRLYIDLLIVRQVDADGTMDNIPLRKGDQVMASSWMTHRHPQNFDRPEEFDAERFLHKGRNTGELTSTTSGLGGKYFPFGGGHHMCPGRNFARQEILGTVAVLLLNFDISFLSFVERKGDRVELKGSSIKEFPQMVDALPGNQVMGLKGDMLMHIREQPRVVQGKTI
ncbi:cytochrome P450, family 7, subfamily B [Xylariales sp. AK1849]|nr:cytochrome P450, family 7, subfamily B [Xylariales sp. AK1849]